QAAREAGFNRLSIGVQDLDPLVQEAIHRIQPPELVQDVTETARRLGFQSISYDLIYGLPHQTLDGFLHTLSQVIAMAPDRLSLFGYAHVPWTKKRQRLIHDSWLPTPEMRMQIFIEAVRMLTKEGGYNHIGMDHFARPDDPLSRARDAGSLQRNFQGYSTHAGMDLIGFGISSISQIEDAYAQNVLGLQDYYNLLDRNTLATVRGYRMTVDDKIRRHVIMQLMCNLRIETADVERRFGIDFWTYFEPALRELRAMEDDGLVEVLPAHIAVSETGRFFVRNVAMVFDAYLKTDRKLGPIYSRTV
ncbi:MAG: oxygen-independent coproporphyrinogen III oxidase, partial [Rhodothermales bacterium]